MADLKLDTGLLRSYANRISNVNKRLDAIDKRLDKLYLRVGLLDLYNLIIADLLTSYSYRLQRSTDYLNQSATLFEDVENGLKKIDPDKIYIIKAIDAVKETAKKAINNVEKAFEVGTVASAWDMFWDGSLSYSDKNSKWSSTSDPEEANRWDFLTSEKSGSVTPTYGTRKDKKILGDEDHFDVNKSQKKKNGKQVNEEESFYKDPKATLFEVKEEAKIEGSVLHGHLEGENEWAQGSLDAKVLTAEAHASASAGFYEYTKDKDGKTVRVFSPAISAEIGASCAAFHGEAEGRIGLGEDNNMLGLYGDASVDLLQAEAKGKASLSKNEVYLGASAEANLVKVSGSAGVSVLGADIGVTGSLKVGVGAHAEVGYTDGKLKVDVGAAIGVGFDLGFEVDVSGTVNAVKGAAESVFNSASKVVEGATKVAQNTAKAVTNTAKAVSNGIKSAGKSIKNFFGSIF